MENTGKNIINLILNELGIKAPTFANRIGVKYQRILDIQNGKTKKVSPVVAQSIIESFPQFNKVWILTGEGEMLNTPSELPVKSTTSGVPYYNVDFIGGFDIILNDQTTTPEYLIDFKEYNKATCWCNITGHSMEPEINHGDIIALKEITDFSFLPYGEVYAIITTNGMRTVKRIGPASSPENYSLIPTNKSPEYGVQEIPRNYIYKVYQVLGSVKRF